MSPKEKHIPDNAARTSVCFTAAQRQAIQWIREVRRNENNNRRTTNDIVVDALFYYLEKEYGKTQDQMEGMVPPVPPRTRAKVTTIKPKH